MGKFQAAATRASDEHVSSGPMKAIVPLSLISVIILMALAARDDFLRAKPDDVGFVPMSAAKYSRRRPGSKSENNTVSSSFSIVYSLLHVVSMQVN